MQFIDETSIYVKAGNGGNGAVSFRRVKYIPKGGPDGGDGGKGGNIIFRVSKNINTLYDFKYKKEYFAENGENGHGANRHGKKGKDLIINIPIGTEIIFKNHEKDNIDCIDYDKEIILAKGGNGGFGNTYFKSSINQAPKRANPGQDGEEFELTLKLKIISDVGLLGLPNAGKSTFISSITNVKAKIANYPFTTLEPQLGVVKVEDCDFVIADLPGLIKDASLGKGLGHRFLKHTERCRILLHLVDINSENIVQNYNIIRNELRQYSKKLLNKLEIVCLTKCDSLSKEEIEEKTNHFKKETKIKQIFPISSISKYGLKDLLIELKNKIMECKNNI